MTVAVQRERAMSLCLAHVCMCREAIPVDQMSKMKWGNGCGRTCQSQQ